LPEEAGIGAGAVAAREGGLVLEAARVAREQLGGRDWADPGFVEQRVVARADEVSEQVDRATAQRAVQPTVRAPSNQRSS
jgi:hypothetical protein